MLLCGCAWYVNEHLLANMWLLCLERVLLPHSCQFKFNANLKKPLVLDTSSPRPHVLFHISRTGKTDKQVHYVDVWNMHILLGDTFSFEKSFINLRGKKHHSNSYRTNLQMPGPAAKLSGYQPALVPGAFYHIFFLFFLFFFFLLSYLVQIQKLAFSIWKGYGGLNLTPV